MTKFRTGLVLGLTTGYYLGAKAGRPRYEQLNRAARRLRRTPAIESAATTVGRAKAVVDLGRERVHDAVDHSDTLPEPVLAETGQVPVGLTYVAR